MPAMNLKLGLGKDGDDGGVFFKQKKTGLKQKPKMSKMLKTFW
jgi:hypothetical protein